MDKSYAQSAKPGDLLDLANHYIVLITSSFYFESFQKLDENRKKIFAGFPEFRRAHSPKLYRHERETLTPAQSIEAVPLHVNPDIVSGKRILTQDEQKCMDDFEINVVRPGIEFWNEVIDHGVVGFQASEIQATASNFDAFLQLLKKLRDSSFVRQVATELNVPHASLIDTEWYTFRFLQARLLHGLTLKYLSSDPHWHRPDEEQLEHDVHDIDYLTVGMHACCFACNESTASYRKLGWRFKFLCPEGRLL